MSDGRKASAPALEIKGLNVYYGASHALQGVDLGLNGGVLSVVGRNGMGKTTLCKAIMGLEPASSGTISFGGQVLNGKSPAEIARMGVGYVPQGRRLWRSLTVDEHLRLVARSGGAWTIERIYDSFPRLAERKSNGGAQLSGGEQQMLAIGRALLLNPRLLVMDEPTEGLAPVIVSHVEDMLLKLAAEGDIDVLVIEQNIGVATSVAETVAVMVNGRVSRIVPSRDLAADRDLQQRLLGVGQHAHDEDADAEPTQSDMQAGSLSQQYQAASHPIPQITRWSSIEGAGNKPIACGTEPDQPGILVLGAMSRTATEIRTTRALLRDAGHKVTTVDISTAADPASLADVPAHQLAAWHPRGAAGIHDGVTPDPRLGVAEALERFLTARPGVEGVLAILDLGEAAIIVPRIIATLGQVPVLVVAPAASSDLLTMVTGGRLLLFPADGDAGLTRAVRAGAQAMAELLAPVVAGNLGARVAGHVALISGLAGGARAASVTAMLGLNHRCVTYAPTRAGVDELKLAIASGVVKAVIDLDQSDIAAQMLGGVIDTVPDRIEELCTADCPYVSVLGGGDLIYTHRSDGPGISIRKSVRAEAETVGRSYAAALNASTGRITVIVPAAPQGSPAFWTGDAFVSVFEESGQRKLVRSPGAASSGETMQYLARALDESLKGDTPGRRSAVASVYGASAP
ncbi:ATP-binding cassette domain-containing protein [Ruegeria pomeroyi]|uniref:ATP-binding cassette domain-containing protein n=1 Tax=Ruegeria pomeroyi TaxID=89184 RepID=A0A9Q3WPD9_9RHOB|nr:ATP-binding cassette domain-containing protein [Ruegeria pomeroyi]MCE8539960.1 ATP-binding cassette domain-containing protein [Ruegeria pomeroyi]